MYGKHFASTYKGSMFGAGTDVFAVWGYVIANTIEAQVELNPRYLAAVLGASAADIQKAIEFLCSPDINSRSKNNSGCRLVREGEFAYCVPNHETYRAIRSEDDRREYNRIKQAESRARKKDVNASVNDMSAMSAHTEAEAEAEAEAETDKKEPLPANADEVVFSYWQAVHGKQKHSFTKERRKAVRARLKKYPVEQIMLAIDGCKKSPTHQGNNDRGTIYDDLELICRNDTKLETFISLGEINTNGNNSKPQWQIDIDNCDLCNEKGYLPYSDGDIKVCKHNK